MNNNTKFALQQSLKDFYMDIPVYQAYQAEIGDENYLDSWVSDNDLSKKVYNNLTISMSKEDEAIERIKEFFNLRDLKCVIQSSGNTDDGYYGSLSVAWIEDGEINLYCFGTTGCEF